MYADKDLTDQNMRTLSDKLAQLTKPRLSHYLEKSGAEKYDDISGSKRDRLLHILEEGNGTDEIRRFLTTTVQEEFDFSDETFFESALEGSRFIVETDPRGGIKLLVDHSKVIGDEVQSHQSYLEEHAPKDTINEFNDAREKLAEGDYTTSLHKCRMALDSLTKTGFKEALDQLHSEGLIEKIDQSTESPYTNKIREYRFVYSAWSWTSWLGSHTSDGSQNVTKDQAEVGFTLTAEVLYYLVRIINDNPSANLDKWASL